MIRLPARQTTDTGGNFGREKTAKNKLPRARRGGPASPAARSDFPGISDFPPKIFVDVLGATEIGMAAWADQTREFRNAILALTDEKQKEEVSESFLQHGYVTLKGFVSQVRHNTTKQELANLVADFEKEKEQNAYLKAS